MIDHGKQADPGSSSTPNTGTSHTGSPSADSLKQQGKDTAHDISEAAQHQAENLYNRQRDTAAEQTHKFTSVLNKMADEFDNQHQPYFSQQVRKLAHTADRFSDKLRSKDLKSLCQEAQSYSRREPALFFGGAIAAGFLVTRFLRSSGQHSHSSSQYGYSPDGQPHASTGAYSSRTSPTPGDPSAGIMHGSTRDASQDPTVDPDASQPGATSLGVTTPPSPGTSTTPGSSAGSVNKPGGPGRI